MKSNIVFIDDDELVLFATRTVFSDRGIAVDTFSNPQEAIDYIERNPDQYDLAVVDYQMPIIGSEVVKEIKGIDPQIKTVILSGNDSQKVIRECRLAGADHYYLKGSDSHETLSALLDIAWSSPKASRSDRRAVSSNEQLISETMKMVGVSDEMREIAQTVKKFSLTKETVLVIGESGVGKEKVAESVHLNSPRSSGPFVALNCGAIPENLVESELFGHVRGAFTGAISNQAGKFVAANGGTLFLDEIGELPLVAQTKLLRVLQEKRVTPVGATESKKVDVRIVAATNRNLLSEIDRGTFRDDLYYRLNILRIDIPPLRERPADIVPLANFFLAQLNEEYQVEKSFGSATLSFLSTQKFKGNVRELQNAVSKAFVMADGILEICHFTSKNQDLESHSGPETYHQFVDSVIDPLLKEYLNQVLVRAGGSRTKAAAIAGLNYTTYLSKRKKLGMDEHLSS